jgi:two-component sensor histidine kinase
MSVEYSSRTTGPAVNVALEEPDRRTIASYERELTRQRRTEIGLREALVREGLLLREKDELIQQQAVLSEESDHRLLNGLQMIVSLLSLQGRAATNTEVASQLATAANRVAAIGRIHRLLHSSDGAQVFALKRYLEVLCRDLSLMLSAERPERSIVVDGIEIEQPAGTAIPLGFIANELITNAVKYGTGPITVRLEPNPPNGYALTVANEGAGLREGFDPAAHRGLGMKIIRSLVDRMDGELRFSPGDDGQGARFTVLFS